MMNGRTRRRKVRKLRWKRLFLYCCGLCFLAICVTGWLWFQYHVTPVATGGFFGQTVHSSDSVNILFMGVDEEDPESGNHSKRSDTMMLVGIHPSDGYVDVLSIPRDTLATIPGHRQQQKINHAFFYGGAQLSCQAVEELLQIPVHYHVVVDLSLFVKLVDALGGVDLYVDRNMDYEDPYANLQIHLRQGYQHLDGEHAAEYVRFRSDELGDIGRIKRQQRFIAALTDQCLSWHGLVAMPQIVSVIRQNVTTDLTGYHALKVLSFLKFFNHDKLEIVTVPGKFAMLQGVSYWIHNPVETDETVTRMFEQRSQIPETQARTVSTRNMQ